MIAQRNFGLDLTRTLAIWPVVIAHLPLGGLPLYRYFGLMGVETFFTLSGYLIVQMIFERFSSLSSSGALSLFAQNRWWRTMPMYFLFLGIHVVGSNWIKTVGFWPVPPIWPYLTFSQNLIDGSVVRYFNFYGVSWTLALEEWFYAATAIALFFYSGNKGRGAVTWFTALAIFGLLSRWIRFSFFDDGSLNMDDMYRGVVLMRADAFSFGAFAYLASAGVMGIAAARLYKKRSILLFFIGTLTIAFCLLSPIREVDVFEKVIRFTLIPIGLALMLPLTTSLSAPTPAIRSVAYFFSTRTYAIYLSHMPIKALFEVIGVNLNTFGIAAYLVSVILISDLIYRYFERPVMALRPVEAKRSA